MEESLPTFDPFMNTPEPNSIQDQIDALIAQGQNTIGNVNSLQVGAGNNALLVDQSGLSLGGSTFADATSNAFSVDMQGNMNAQSLTAPNVTVKAANITGSIQATQIQSNSLTSTQISSSYVYAGTINATQITAGDISSSRMQTNVLTALQVNATTLSAITANVGTLTAGTISGVTLSMPNESLSTGSSGKLIWASGARIWGDSGGSIGINGHGNEVDIYASDNQRMTFSASGQNSMNGGLYIHSTGGGGNVNIDGSLACNAIRLSNNSQENNITDVNIIKGFNDVNLQLGDNSYHISFYNVGFTEVAYIDSSGNIHKNGSVSFDIPHPERKGWRIKYPAIESPEVALTIRGIAKTVGGVAIIKTPHHWKLVTEENGLNTVKLTPLAKTRGLYVPKNSLTNLGFEVRLVSFFDRDVEFCWELTAVRKNYLNFKPVYKDTSPKAKK